jgi:hypothetical protein
MNPADSVVNDKSDPLPNPYAPVMRWFLCAVDSKPPFNRI